jgi:hypothetical protein
LLIAVVLALGCSAGGEPGPECTASVDCAPGESCVDGECRLPMGADGGAPDTGVDAGCACSAGEACTSGVCVPDCGNPEAVTCGGGDVCDFATGRCVPEGSTGILTGDGERCGDDGPLCLPGTECTLAGTCAAAPPCFATSCTADGTACWGRSCVSERPKGACAPAPLDRMNMDDFLRDGDGGAFDLEFDDACNAYAVTMISGPDYLRQLEPDGTLTVWTGVTNLNMGEVAVLRLPGGEFGKGDGLGDVALSYVCCATCGCISTDPQGVARLDRAGTESLPMVVTATPSPGDGPWGVVEVDTGPYGLTWGRDNRLYVGNVAAQGDLVRADLDTGSVTTIHELGTRIHAAASFDQTSLLVALDGGTVVRVATDGAETAPWAEVGEDVTSLVRDPFTGRVYVSVRSARILEHAADGTPLGELATAPAAGRLAYAPDGFLYYLVVGWPTTAMVHRYDLPATL